MNKRQWTTLLLAVFWMGILAQNTLRVNYNNGTQADIPLADIASLSFVNTTTDTATIVGSWLWGSLSEGYYELLTFNADKTYTGYDNFFEYGFDTQTYGLYSFYGAMLTLLSNGVGYQRRYNWYVATLTANALSVMTRMGPFTYYSMKPDVIHLHTGETIEPDTGDTFVFADGVVAAINKDCLVACSPGTTYILKSTASLIHAYKVVVE